MITIDDFLRIRTGMESYDFNRISREAAIEVLTPEELNYWGATSWKDPFTAEVVARPEFQAAFIKYRLIG